MIIDTLDHLASYAPINPLFAEVVDFLRTHDLHTLEEGKHVISEGLFVNIQTATAKTPAEATLETHRRMIDIQIPLDGPETFGYTPLAQLPDLAYNEDKDITKYPSLAAQTYVECQPGMMAIFFPNDGHAPCIAERKEIKKAIFKVRNI